MLEVQHIVGTPEYLGSPFLLSEPERLKALTCCFQQNCLPQSFYDAVGRLVSTIFGMPVGTVVFIDDEFANLKGASGVELAEPTPREHSICTWTLVPLNPEVLVVEDLTADGRYASHPAVCQPPFIGFYASAPLVTSTGFRLGTLYVLFVCACDSNCTRRPQVRAGFQATPLQRRVRQCAGQHGRAHHAGARGAHAPTTSQREAVPRALT